MDWPKPPAPPVRDSRAAFRAQGVGAFLAVDAALSAIGLSVPAIIAADREAGLLLMEDFGSQGVLVDGAPDPQRYAAAIDVLAAIHAAPRGAVLPVPGGGEHRLLPLLGEALMADLALFADWYVPHATGDPLDRSATESFMGVWTALFARLADAEESWVLFDMQSPNLFWLPERAGIARIGLIDFQDMFVGPAAYDVATLCHDARVTVSPELEAALRDRYVALRRATERDVRRGIVRRDLCDSRRRAHAEEHGRLRPACRSPRENPVSSASSAHGRLPCAMPEASGSIRTCRLV